MVKTVRPLGRGMPHFSSSSSNRSRSSAMSMDSALVPMMRTPRLSRNFGELDGRLAAEAHHHADRLLHLDDVHDILGEQRLEVQPVGGIVVRGDSLGVVVDNHHLIAQLLQRPHTVDRGVIKLDALADADGAGAQHHDDRPAGPGEGPGLAEVVVGGVEIGRLRVKLGAAGVHHLVHRVPVLRQFSAAGKPAESLIGIAQPLLGPPGTAPPTGRLQWKPRTPPASASCRGTRGRFW